MSATPDPAQSSTEGRYQFPDWAYGMVKQPNDREPPNVAAQLAASLLKKLYGWPEEGER